MKLFHGDIEVNKWYEEEQLVLKSYYGENLIYGEEELEPSFPNLCYGVTDDISTYTATTFNEVYDTSSNKWYILNNFNQYEEYGVIEEVSCEATLEEIPTYVGKLVNHCDGHEFECVEFDDGFPMYEYLGDIETITEETEETITIDNTSPSPLIGTTFPTNFKIAKTSFGSNFFTFSIYGTNSEELSITNNPWSPNLPVEYRINNNAQNVYDDGEGYYVFESNEADFEIQIVNYYDSTPTDIIYTSTTEETIYPKEYDEKSDPDNYITFDTMEEAYSYSGCVYVGMVAIIGGDGYMLNDNYEWEESLSLKHLNFTATNGDATIGMMTSGTAPNISYSFDKETWTSWDFSDITIPNGSTLYMKGTNSTMDGGRFAMIGSIAANGNIMSLLYGDNFIGQLTIPSNECFYSLFNGCTSLTTAPQLPATTLTENCYYNMFAGCSSLTAAPQLPAKTLANYCYWNMFAGCTSLTSAPTLPSTTLTEYCYMDMFYNCTSLTTAPTLLAITLASNCYYGMFQGCTNLNYIKAMFTTTPSNTYTYNWVYGVAASGTFVKNANAAWDVSGDSGVPSGWNVVNSDYKAKIVRNGQSDVYIPNDGSTVLTSGETNAYSSTTISVEITTAVTSIGQGAFQNFTALTSVTLDDSVTSIGEAAFAYCSSLTDFEIPSGVTTVDVATFYQCTSLPSITIPSGVTSIGYVAFLNCQNLTSIISLATTAPSVGNDIFVQIPLNGTLYYPSGSDYSSWRVDNLAYWTFTPMS